jgi:pimeloyl-ACP methyl ester carboxylesterase
MPGALVRKVIHTLLSVVFIFLFSGCQSAQKSIFELGLSMERYRSDLVYKTISVNGEQYAYLEREGDGETIILLHGFAANKDSWIRFVRYLPETYRVVVLDMPGHGDNKLDMNRTYDIDYVTNGVTNIIDGLDIEKFHLAGNSFGGLVSTLYALNTSERLMTLGLFDSAGVKSPVKSEFYGLLEKGDNPLVVTSDEGFDRLMRFIFYDEPFIPWPGRPVLTRRFIERGEFNQKMWNDLFENRLDENLNARIAELSMPVFIVWGDHDRVLHVTSTVIYKENIPDPYIVVMKDCGHAPMLERPDEAAEHYSTFLEKR